MADIYQDPATGNVVFDNLSARFEILTTLPRGIVVGFTIKSASPNPLICPFPFLIFSHRDETPGATHPNKVYSNPASVRFDPLDQDLEFHFVTPAVASIVVHCHAYESYFTFAVESVSLDEHPERYDIYLAQFQFKLPAGSRTSTAPSWIQTSAYFIAEIPLTPTTQTMVGEPSGSDPCVDDSTRLLRSHTRSDLRGFIPTPAGVDCPTGSASMPPTLELALIACLATVDSVDLIEQIEVQHHLPRSTINCLSAKQHPDVKTSYLFVDIHYYNQIDILELAQLGHFQYIVCYADTWSDASGGNIIDTINFPAGLASLRELVDLLHNTKVNPANDPLLPNIWGESKFKFGLHTLSWRITPSRENNWQYQDDTRLAAGTVENGKKVPDLLTHSFDLPDLICEVAKKFSIVYNDVCADYVFLDGVQGASLSGLPEWYGIARVTGEFLAKLEGNVLSQAAGYSDYAWHPLARHLAGDYVALGVEAYMDQVRLKRKQIYDAKGMPFELGWIGLLGRPVACPAFCHKRISDSFPSTTLEQIEYQLNRSLIVNAPISIETTCEDLATNRQAREILSLIGKYEQIRLSSYFDPAFVNSLQVKDEWFGSPGQSDRSGGLAMNRRRVFYQLEKDERGTKYGLRRRVVFEFLARGDGSEEWIIDNPFGRQPLKARVTALPVTLDFDHPDNILLLSTPILSGPGSEELAGEWDLSDHKAIGIQASGFERGEILNVTLEDVHNIRRQYQWEILSDMEQLYLGLIPAAQELVDEDLAGEDGDESVEIKRSLRPICYSQITKITITLKRRSASTASRYIGPIQAIKQLHTDLDNPRFTLNGATSVYGSTLSPRYTSERCADVASCACGYGRSLADTHDDLLVFYEPWDYLTINQDKIEKFDGNHNMAPEPTPGGNDLIAGSDFNGKLWLSAGPNRLRYSHTGGNHAWISVWMEGELEVSAIPRPHPSCGLLNILKDWVFELFVDVFHIRKPVGDPPGYRRDNQHKRDS